jgi:hypothetical protein
MRLGTKAGGQIGAATERTPAAVLGNPNLSGRMPNDYDPAIPSYLYRAAQLLIHHRIGEDGRLKHPRQIKRVLDALSGFVKTASPDR